MTGASLLLLAMCAGAARGFGGGAMLHRRGLRAPLAALPARGYASLDSRRRVISEPPEKVVGAGRNDTSSAQGADAARLRAQDELWEGNKEGFDWEMEKMRRKVEDIGFAPFRMDPWKPTDEGGAAAASGGDGMSLSTPGWFDASYIIFTNVMQFLGAPSVDGAPVAKIQPYRGSIRDLVQNALTGKLEMLAGGPLFSLLYDYFKEQGPVFKLAFGPKSFIVVSDPVMAKHVLRENAGAYDKGVLAEILEPIMGKGLIPADPKTWKVRRRAIVPGFHRRWLNRMMQLYSECTDTLVRDLRGASDEGRVVDMEERFCSVSLDIIGAAVFNYEFASVTKESPIIKAVYRVLREAEHRSVSFVPYWNIPFAERLFEDQRAFRENLVMLNTVLDELIERARSSAEKRSIEELESSLDSASVDPSLLRFLVDMRGEETTSTQLRDDLMTMLIAGHETTAAVLTWSLFELVRHPEELAAVRREIEEVLGDRPAGYDDLQPLRRTRHVLAETLRLYPEPPILIRRALREDVLPQGGSACEGGVRVLKGTDLFLCTWNLHRSEQLWEEPERFDPSRWDRPHANEGVRGWKGYDPSSVSGLYPNEIAADFAFLPFGGGSRKCIGDQFAMMEATVILTSLLREFDFEFEGAPEDVGMVTGATIHTANQLRMRVKRRKK